MHFDTDPVEEANNLLALEEQIQRIVALNKLVNQMDRKLGLTKEYLMFQAKQGKNGSGSIGSLLAESDPMEYEYIEEAPWTGNEVDDDDETVMYDFQG